MKLTITLLRGPAIRMNNIEILTDLNTKGRMLVFYMAANKDKVFSREYLSDLLWPDVPAENAKSNLRQTLWLIKKSLKGVGIDQQLVESDKGNCVLNPAIELWVDLHYFAGNIAAALPDDGDLPAGERISLLQSALDLHEAPFLDDFYVKGSAVLDEWILFEREDIRRLYVKAAKRLAGLYAAEGRTDRAVECLNRVLVSNSLEESVHLELMRLYRQSGERHKAVMQYNTLAKILRRELNISPGEEATGLYRQMMGEEAAPPAPEAPPASPLHVGSGEAITLKLDGGQFAGIPYEGYSRLLEPLLFEHGCRECELAGEFAALFPQLGPVAELPPETTPAFEMRLAYSVGLLLARVAQGRELTLILAGVEAMDGKSAALCRYLAGRAAGDGYEVIVV